MNSVPTYTSIATFGASASKIVPDATTYSGGYLAGQRFPAQHENYFMNGLTANDNQLITQVNSIQNELLNLLAQYSITPTGANTQVRDLIVAQLGLKVSTSSVGNASGNIPLNNGTLNVNLNADLLDGYSAGNASGNVAVSNGTLNTNLNANYLQGYATGQTGTGYIPYVNGSGNMLLGINVDAGFPLYVKGSAASNWPATSGTTQNASILRLRGNSNASLDMGSSAQLGFWLQSVDVTSLGTSYPLALNPNGGLVFINRNSDDTSGALLQVNGGISATTFIGAHSGNGSLLTSLNASNLSSGTVPFGRILNRSAINKGNQGADYTESSLSAAGEIASYYGNCTKGTTMTITAPANHGFLAGGQTRGVVGSFNVGPGQTFAYEMIRLS